MSGTWSSAVAEVGGWGPFFAVATHEEAAPSPPWRPLRELVDRPDVLFGRIAAARAHLASGAGRRTEQVELRVAASVTHLGLVARLLSPALGLTIHSGLMLRFGLDDLWWQPNPGGLFPLSVAYRDGGTPEELVNGPIAELGAAFAVPEQILRGNVASAINGAAAMIRAARPDLATRAATVAESLLATARLRGTHTIRADSRFQRRSCCLIYRAAPDRSRAAVCGDCVLAD